MPRDHPDHNCFNRDDEGPAAIIFNDGTAVYAEQFAYTTAIKYVDENGMAQTTKAPAIKRIV